MQKERLSRWKYRIQEDTKQPAYKKIADLIEEDVDTGHLQTRDRLPPLRDLAKAIGINYTTAARAYTEARKRGLIDSHPGSGSYVKGKTARVQLGPGSYEMTMNLVIEPSIPTLIEQVRDSAIAVMAQHDLYSMLRYQAFGGQKEDREAAMKWLSRRIKQPVFEQTLVSPGIHSTLVGLVTLLVRPGQSLCVESLCYPGIKAIAAQLGLTLHSLDRDSDGPLVRAFEDICKRGNVGALYINPTIQNPTTTTISKGRREAIADVALRYNIPIIEDDAYTMLSTKNIAPFAEIVPELTYYITGTSKCFGPGVRSAFLYAPSKRHAQRATGAMRAMSVMSSPLTDAIVTEWINDGTAEAMIRAIRTEAKARLKLAEKYLGRQRVHSEEGAFHLWLNLPKANNWNPSELAVQLREHGVSAVSSAAFSTDNNPPNALRVCFGGPISRSDWEEGLHAMADLIEQPSYLSAAHH